MDALETRIDKYLWAIRIFKTRSLASEALDGGKVKLNGDTVKASKKVKIGEVYVIKKDQQTLEIEVLKIIEKRVSATLAQECYTLVSHTTPESLKQLHSSFFIPNIHREKGKGRPTKRERRDMDEFLDDE